MSEDTEVQKKQKHTRAPFAIIRRGVVMEVFDEKKKALQSADNHHRRVFSQHATAVRGA